MKSKKLRVVLIVSIACALIAGTVLGIYLMQSEPEQQVVKRKNVADIEWYSEEDPEFVITTAEELNDLAVLSDFYDFKGQTIKLGADIVMNEGNAEDWADNAPKNRWFPIVKFAGTFDGQGHTISGLYASSVDGGIGLFQEPQKTCVIRDFKLVNTYFRGDGSGGGAIIASGGYCSGTFQKIYTDGILEFAGTNSGGILGEMNGEVVMEECWFDGIIRTSGWVSGGLIGKVKIGDATINHCLSSGKVISTFDGPAFAFYAGSRVGGLIGLANRSGAPKITINDSLTVTEVSADNTQLAGTVMGYCDNTTTVLFTDAYAVSGALNDINKSSTNVTIEGTVLSMAEESLTGYGAYQWTTLDFENYWAVDPESTPVLKYFADEVPDLSGVARNLDTSWYNDDSEEFILNTKEELFGFAMVCTAKGKTFEGKTVKLGKNITLNAGNASEWGEKAPLFNWPAIQNFAGTFDGQNHTISGIYLDSISTGQGFFGSAATGSVIKNFRLVNSYFRVTNNKLASNASVALGSIVGTGNAVTIENVYSSAIVVNAGESGMGTGGLVGSISGTYGNVIRNCWFDGSVDTHWNGAAGIVGYVGNGTVSVEHCLNSGSVHKTFNNTASRIGGICGYLLEWSSETTLEITDTLNVGMITSDNANQSGSIVGFSGGNANKNMYPEIITKDVYTTLESHSRVATDSKGPATLPVAVMDEAELTGYQGYVQTTLDFKNYWAVNIQDTPVLKRFASNVPSIANVQRYDTSWYNEKNDTYVLMDKWDLGGFSLLSAMGNEFKGKTVKLGANIVFNEGNASDWKSTAPELNWIAPQNFAGTFDGQGYTISGIYLDRTTTKQGLFGSTKEGSVIKNFRLVNSYFCVTNDKLASNASVSVGSIVGEGSGTIQSVYSNATVVSAGKSGWGCGGLVGAISTVGEHVISDCWFDGYVETAWWGAGGIIGYLGSTKLDISHCLVSGNVHQTEKAQASRVGGICGYVLAWSKETQLTITDTLIVGKITSVNANQNGSILGYSSGNANKELYPIITGNDVYVTSESHSRAAGSTTGYELSAVAMKKSEYMGYDGYTKTALNFTDYWVVDLQGTPILRTFAGNGPSLAGVPRYDTSWYNEKEDTFVLTDIWDLCGFSLLSSLGNDFKGKTVVLGQDIIANEGNASDWGITAPEISWMAIQNFAGTFDGNGKTISGIYLDQTEINQGLFGSTKEGSVIKDFRLVNSYFRVTNDTLASNASVSLGSIVGLGSGTIEDVYSNATVVSAGKSGWGLGGLVGAISGTDGNVIRDCWFDGYAETAWWGAAGIIGYIGNAKVSIEHCLNSGNVHQTASGQASRVGGICGYVMAWSRATELNITDTLNVGVITSVNANQNGSIMGFSSGNANTGLNPVIKGSDVYTTSESHSRVNGSSTGFTLTVTRMSKSQYLGYGGYVNTSLDFDKHWAVVLKPEEGTPILQKFADGIPSLDGAIRYDTSWYDKAKGTTDDPYILEDAADLYGLAILAATNDFAGKTIRLGADIVINKNTPKTLSKWKEFLENSTLSNWNPIGSGTKPFAGTFDGNGKTISGIYMKNDNGSQGFFGTIQNATIKNLQIKNSYFENSTGGIGSIAGWTKGTSKIENVYSNAVIVNTRNDGGNALYGRAGGMIGVTEGPMTIIGSWYDGEISTTSGMVAGFVAQVSGATTIRHCLNTSTIASTYAPSRAGGIAGYVHSDLTVEGFLNQVNLSTGNANQSGTVFGFSDIAQNRIKMTSVYTTTDQITNLANGTKYSSLCKNSGGSANVYTGTIKIVGEEKMKGDLARQEDGAPGLFEGDGENYWTTTDELPILKAFFPETAKTAVQETNTTIFRQMINAFNIFKVFRF